MFYCYIHWLSAVERRRRCGRAEHRLPAACGQVSVGRMQPETLQSSSIITTWFNHTPDSIKICVKCLRMYIILKSHQRKCYLQPWPSGIQNQELALNPPCLWCRLFIVVALLRLPPLFLHRDFAFSFEFTESFTLGSCSFRMRHMPYYQTSSFFSTHPFLMVKNAHDKIYHLNHF